MLDFFINCLYQVVSVNWWLIERSVNPISQGPSTAVLVDKRCAQRRKFSVYLEDKSKKLVIKEHFLSIHRQFFKVSEHPQTVFLNKSVWCLISETFLWDLKKPFCQCHWQTDEIKHPCFWLHCTFYNTEYFFPFWYYSFASFLTVTTFCALVEGF